MIFELLYFFLAVIVLPVTIVLILYNTILWGLKEILATTNTVIDFILQIIPEAHPFEVPGEGAEIPGN